MMTLTLFCLLAYLLGSISSAILICRIAGLPDPRTIGSANPGTTNVLRTGNKWAAIATLLGDALKGAIPVLLAKHVNHSPSFIGPIMIAVVIGHLYPIFFQFKGGKGVATAIGAILALCWPLGLTLILTWILVFFTFKISSLAALVAVISAPLYTGYWLGKPFVPMIAVLSLLLIWRHQDNIKRLIQRKENKIQ